MHSHKRYLTVLAGLPCVLCGCYGVQIHHIREGQGMAQRASDWLTVPLCPACHTGNHGVHGDRATMYLYKKSELDLLADTLAAVIPLLMGRRHG